MKSLRVLFFLVLICYGMNAGLGFSNVMGMLPALQAFSEPTYVEAHQGIDRYYAARYPVFANLTLVLTLIVLWLLYKHQRTGFYWTLAALGFLVVNIIVAITMCVPLNQVIQSWAVNNPPENWQAVRQEIISCHYIRAVLDWVAFGLLALGYTFTLGSLAARETTKETRHSVHP